MKWLIGAVVALASLTACAETSTLDKSSAFKELSDGGCSTGQSQFIEEHISGQITAFSKADWESAYSFASPGFRAAIGLDQFIFIIGAQYPMLINNQSVQFSDCTLLGDEITQIVSVTSENEVFGLRYSLSFDGEELGIESASPILAESQTTI
jgi:hypothetical protein